MPHKRGHGSVARIKVGQSQILRKPNAWAKIFLKDQVTFFLAFSNIQGVSENLQISEESYMVRISIYTMQMCHENDFICTFVCSRFLQIF